ncbi:MAG: hypothetical protein ACJAUV_002001 [Flavobacteriales bacterium]|jgi:hypothetical protein
MKLLTAIIFQVCFVMSSMAQNNQSYYQIITKAQLAFVEGNYSKASQLYAKAFKVQKAFAYDLYQAMQIELNYGTGDEKIIKHYLKTSGGKGTDMSGEEYVKNMSLAYPKFGELPYLNDIIDHFNNTEPVKQEEYKHANEFEELLKNDQGIRDSVRQVLGYGIDAYKSVLGGRILQVDKTNMEKLLVLLQDKALNEFDCHECFNNLETVISHAASNGNTDWIKPLQSIQLEGRMNVRRFVRIIDGAHNSPDTLVSKKLKEKGLYYGSFNGIRLYSLMYFIQYNKEEKHMINQNRKKIGFMAIADEIKIKTWQFLDNDLMNFQPSLSFMYADGTEDEATIKSMLKEQETMLQHAVNTQKEQGGRELIIVRKEM